MTNSILMTKLATVNDRIRDALNGVQYCENILTVLASGKKMRASEVATELGDVMTFADGNTYVNHQKVTRRLKTLKNIGLVKREEIGTEVIRIDTSCFTWNPATRTVEWTNTGFDKEVPVAYFSLVGEG